MESVAFETDLVKLYSLQHLALVALEPGCRIVDIDPQYGAYILAGEIRHQHSAHRPVNYIDTVHITAADSHISPVFGAGIIELEQILRIMTKVGIHLKDIVILMLYSPLEAAYICGAESELALPL